MSYVQHEFETKTQANHPIQNALTIEVEDWFHGLDLSPGTIANCTPRLDVGLLPLLELLDKYRVKATFFILGLVVEQWQSLLGQIVDAGHEIGLHGFEHTPVYRLTPTELTRDLRRGRAAISQITDAPLLSYRAPYFSITKESLWALPLISKAGIVYDSSVVPAHNPRYGLPLAPQFPHLIDVNASASQQNPTESIRRLYEYPVSTRQVGPYNMILCGGFYARFLPYPIIWRNIQAINAAGKPAIFYLHPWELDPHHPKLRGEIRPLYRFTHYFNLKSMAKKLENLLSDFRFGPLSALPTPSLTRSTVYL